MKLTNEKIYQIASVLLSTFNNLEIYIPAKANFFIQKNIATITIAAQEIEKARLEVAQHYGEKLKDSDDYTIPKENISNANNELQDLFKIEQDIDIKTFSIKDLGDAKFTPAQMQAIMIMIED